MQLTEALHAAGGHAYFFFHLADGCRPEINIPRLGLPAGESDLVGVILQVSSAKLNKDRRRLAHLHGYDHRGVDGARPPEA